MLSSPSPERTVFDVGPGPNDLSIYSASHPSQMAKTTSRAHHLGIPNNNEAQGRLPPLALSGNSNRILPETCSSGPNVFDFDNSFQPPGSIQALSHNHLSHGEAAPGWSTMDESRSNSSETLVSQRFTSDYGPLPYPDSSIPVSLSPQTSFLPGLPPLMPNASLSEGVHATRYQAASSNFAHSLPISSSMAFAGSDALHPTSQQVHAGSNADEWASNTMFSERILESNVSATDTDRVCATSTADTTRITGNADHCYHESSNSCNYSYYTPTSGLNLPFPVSEGYRNLNASNLISGRPVGSIAPLDERVGEQVSSLRNYQDFRPVSQESHPAKHRNYRILQPQPQRMAQQLPTLNSPFDSSAKRTYQSPVLPANNLKKIILNEN